MQAVVSCFHHQVSPVSHSSPAGGWMIKERLVFITDVYWTEKNITPYYSATSQHHSIFSSLCIDMVVQLLWDLLAVHHSRDSNYRVMIVYISSCTTAVWRLSEISTVFFIFENTQHICVHCSGKAWGFYPCFHCGRDSVLAMIESLTSPDLLANDDVSPERLPWKVRGGSQYYTVICVKL